MRAALFVFASCALAIGGCGTGSEFDYAVIGPQYRGCPTCGTYVQLRADPVDACELGMPSRFLVVTLYGPVTGPRIFEMDPMMRIDFGARRCDGDDCQSATSGTFEIVSIAGDVYEVRWSVAFLDGSRDEGSASARYCDVDNPPR